MKTLEQIIKEQRQQKKKQSKRVKNAAALMEWNRFMQELNKEFPLQTELTWPSRRELDESSRKMKEMADRFMKKLEEIKTSPLPSSNGELPAHNVKP